MKITPVVGSLFHERTQPTVGRLRFQPSRPAPSLPYQAPNERAENTGIPRRRNPEEACALDPLENDIRQEGTSRRSTRKGQSRDSHEQALESAGVEASVQRSARGW